MITCILLSAGESLRFKSPKALAEIQGQSILEHLQRMLIRSKVDNILIVLGAHYPKTKSCLLKHKKIRLVYNKDYKFGQTHSVQTALKQLPFQTKAFFLLPVDYPLISNEIIDRMINHFMKEHPSVLVPVHEGRKGHPPLISYKLANEIKELDCNQGVNTVIQRYKSQTSFLEFEDNQICRSFNTLEEFQAITRGLP